MKDQLINIANNLLESIHSLDRKVICLTKLIPFSENEIINQIFNILLADKGSLNNFDQIEEVYSELTRFQKFDDSEILLDDYQKTGARNRNKWPVYVNLNIDLILKCFQSGKSDKAEVTFDRFLKHPMHNSSSIAYTAIKLADGKYFDKKDILVGRLDSESSLAIGQLVEAYITAQQGNEDEVDIWLNSAKMAEPSGIPDEGDQLNAVILYCMIADLLQSAVIAKEANEWREKYFGERIDLENFRSIASFMNVGAGVYVYSALLKFNQIENLDFLEPDYEDPDYSHEYIYLFYEIFKAYGKKDKASQLLKDAYDMAVVDIEGYDAIPELLENIIKDEIENPFKAFIMYLGTVLTNPHMNAAPKLVEMIVEKIFETKQESKIIELIDFIPDQMSILTVCSKLAAIELRKGDFDTAYNYIEKTEHPEVAIILLIDELISAIQTPAQFDQFKNFVKKCFPNEAWVKNM